MPHIPSIAQLQSNWFGFSDVDRAMAVQTIKQSGISTRKIAAELHLSESLLRHLIKSLQAPAFDLDLARKGKISTNELIRRAQAGLAPRSSDQRRDTSVLDRGQEIRIAADLICDWLLQTGLFGPAREMIVEETQRKFRLMKEAGLHPSTFVPAAVSASHIIVRTEPLPDDSIDPVAWFANWLCRWALYAFPDKEIRDPALRLALDTQRGSK